MPSNLGSLPRYGVLTTLNKFAPGTSLWMATFLPQDLPHQDFEVWHGAVRGPGGYAVLYLDDQLYGVLENGTINEYAPPTAMYVRSGQAITISWTIGTGAAPQAWLYFREPEVGRL